jgi:hypothetical protein
MLRAPEASFVSPADAVKFLGLISEKLTKGQVLTITMDSAFNTYGSGGTKHLMLATHSNLGARNFVFAYVWLVTGILYLAVAIIYLVLGSYKDLTKHRCRVKMTEYLMSKLSWRKPLL